MNGNISSVSSLTAKLIIPDQENHQYIEIGYWFAHLMLHAQALKFLDDEKGTLSMIGSPVAKSPIDIPFLDYRKQHVSAISQLATQILQRAQLVEVSEIRVSYTRCKTNSST